MPAATVRTIAVLGAEGAPVGIFRAEFDAAMPERALRSIVGYSLRRTWIDLAFLLPALHPGTECRTREDWLAYFGLGAGARHPAVADAFATARRLQIALVAADRAAMGSAAKLVAMQRAQRWLGKLQKPERTRRKWHRGTRGSRAFRDGKPPTARDGSLDEICGRAKVNGCVGQAGKHIIRAFNQGVAAP